MEKSGSWVQAAGRGLKCPVVGWHGLSRAKGKRTTNRVEVTEANYEDTRVLRAKSLLTKYQKIVQQRRGLSLIVKLHFQHSFWGSQNLYTCLDGWCETEVVIYPHNHLDACLLGSAQMAAQRLVLTVRVSPLTAEGRWTFSVPSYPCLPRIFLPYTWLWHLFASFHQLMQLTKLPQTYQFLFVINFLLA